MEHTSGKEAQRLRNLFTSLLSRYWADGAAGPVYMLSVAEVAAFPKWTTAPYCPQTGRSGTNREGTVEARGGSLNVVLQSARATE